MKEHLVFTLVFSTLTLTFHLTGRNSENTFVFIMYLKTSGKKKQKRTLEITKFPD